MQFKLSIDIGLYRDFNVRVRQKARLAFSKSLGL
jgi:hypothetical protein